MLLKFFLYEKKIIFEVVACCIFVPGIYRERKVFIFILLNPLTVELVEFSLKSFAAGNVLII